MDAERSTVSLDVWRVSAGGEGGSLSRSMDRKMLAVLRVGDGTGSISSSTTLGRGVETVSVRVMGGGVSISSTMLGRGVEMPCVSVRVNRAGGGGISLDIGLLNMVRGCVRNNL